MCEGVMVPMLYVTCMTWSRGVGVWECEGPNTI